jgi:hypothetical protein
VRVCVPGFQHSHRMAAHGDHRYFALRILLRIRSSRISRWLPEARDASFESIAHHSTMLARSSALPGGCEGGGAS